MNSVTVKTQGDYSNTVGILDGAGWWAREDTIEENGRTDKFVLLGGPGDYWFEVSDDELIYFGEDVRAA